MDYKYLNKWALDKQIARFEGKNKGNLMWFSDESYKLVWVTDGYGLYSVPKSAWFVDFKQPPNNGDLVESFKRKCAEESCGAMRTQMTCTLDDGRKVEIFELSNGDTVWIDVNLLKPLGLKKFDYAFTGTSKNEPLFVTNGYGEMVALMMPIRHD